MKTVSVHERVASWNSKPWSGVENFGRWKVSVGQQRERSFSLQGNMNYFWKSVRAVSFLLACFAANFPMLDATKTLYIGGLFPMSGSSVASAGKIFLPVSELAIDMVNNRTDLLNGYQLQLIWNDTQVSKIIFFCLLVTSQSIVTKTQIIWFLNNFTSSEFHYNFIICATFSDTGKTIFNTLSTVGSLGWPLMTCRITTLTAYV